MAWCAFFSKKPFILPKETNAVIRESVYLSCGSTIELDLDVFIYTFLSAKDVLSEDSNYDFFFFFLQFLH
jgi:hypothetical protein